MRVESTSGKHAERRTDKRAPRWAINATNYRPALVAITRRTGIVRGALKINPDPIGKDGGATQHQFSPTGETVTYTAQAAELWITDGRSLTPAAEVLERAFQWWRKFFNEMPMS